jgi:hypothetical protein
MQGTARCQHSCNETHGGCLNRSGSHEWNREGGSLKRHEKSSHKHVHCTPACAGYILLPQHGTATGSNSAPTESAGNGIIEDEDEDEDEDVGAMQLDRLQLTRNYRVLFVMNPTRSLAKIPKPQQFAEWVHVDLDGGRRYLDDEALSGFIHLDRSRRAKDLLPLKDGEVPVALHESVRLRL